MIHRVECRLLNEVSLPCTEITLRVCPRNVLVDVIRGTESVPFVDRLTRRTCANATFAEHAGETLQELKDARIGPLVFAECFVIHEQIYTMARSVGYPLRVRVASEWVA